MGVFMLKKVRDRVWEIEEGCNGDIQASKYLISSQIDKENEMKAILDRIDFKYHRNFIIFGIRNVELLSEIYKRKTNFSTMTIIEIWKNEEEHINFECDENRIDFLLDTKTVDIVIGSGKELLRQLDSVLGQTLKLYNLRNIEIISMPYIKSTLPDELEETKIAIFERLHAFVKGFGNSVEDILQGTDNYLNNWKHVFRGIDYSVFLKKYNNVPAVIVGAGPSLEKNIEHLKQVKGNAIIMCVDAALDTLINAGIIPDIVASIERTEITTKFYKREVIPEDIIYLGPNVIPGSILERFDRIIFTGRKGDGLFNCFNEFLGFNNLSIGANVSHILIAFAQYLGCNPIIFVGLDLAYSEGKTHTKLVMQNLDEKDINNVYKNKESIVYVKGQNGEMLETFEFFMYAKTWIEMQISKQEDIKFINATEGGANIEGAQNLKLKDAINEYCSNVEIIPIKEIYDNLFCDYNLNKIEITSKALEFFNALENYFKHISKTSRGYYNKISKDKNNVKNMEKYRFEMDDILMENHAGRFILQSIFISFHRDIHSFPMVINKEDEKKMQERSKEYYDTLYKVSKKVNETIKIYKKILNNWLRIFQKEEGVVGGANK